jgi:hypothetical protein
MLGGLAVDPSLATLTDVDDALAPTGGEVLSYDSVSGMWAAGTPGIGVEDDPQVGSTTNNQWCRGNGSAVQCDQSAPVTSETDPQVGTLTGSKWCAANAGGTAVDCTQDPPGGAPTCVIRSASNTDAVVSVSCNAGETMTVGGCDSDTSDVNRFYPSAIDTYTCRRESTTASMRAYAICCTF